MFPQANAEWAAQTDPSKQRGFHAVAQAVETAAETARAQKAVPRAAVDTVTETFRAHVAQTGAADPGAGDVSFYKARMANEVLKAQTQKVRLAKMKGELVDRDRAIAMVYDMARRERDAWLTWPPRVAANIAAELKVDPHEVEKVLDRYLRDHMAELAEIKIELR